MNYPENKSVVGGLLVVVLAVFTLLGGQVNGAITSSRQASMSAAAATAAATPSLSAQAVSQSSISLNWSGTTPPSTYSVERSLSSSSGFAVILTTGKGVVNFTDTALSPSTTYYYRVRSITEKGKNVSYSEYSNVVSATTLAPDAIAPTATITSPQNGQTYTDTVTVNVDATDNIGIARVELWKNGALAATDTSAPYSFNQNIAVQAATTISYIAKAFDAANNSGSSAAVSITALPPAPLTISADKVLVVYNTNSPDSVALFQYYMANRPGFSTANTLAIATENVEITSLTTFQTTIRQPIIDWMQANSARPIYYVVLLRGIPDRISGNSSVETLLSTAKADMGIKTGAQYGGGTGAAYDPAKYPGTTALITHLNMGSQAATLAYVDKLKSMYNAMPTPNVIISSQGTPNAGNHYYLDEAQGYAGYPLIQADNSSLTSAGVSASRITYTPQTSSVHVATGTDVLGYATWGANGSLGGSYANDGKVIFTGASSWYLIKTIESYNGQWSTGQGNFIDWFNANAFGGTNYSNTPVGAVTHVEEPYTSGVSGPAYFSDWEKGRLFAEAAWDSKQTPYFMAVGDPLIKR